MTSNLHGLPATFQHNFEVYLNGVHRIRSIVHKIVLVFSVTTNLVIWHPPAGASESLEKWKKKSVEAFEAYCYRTSADFEQIDAMAKALKLRPIPDRYVDAFGARDGEKNKGYFVGWNKKEDLFVIVGFSKPNACSIHVQGISYESIRKRIKSAYKLVLSVEDDIGLQETKMYVPGGESGSKIEAREKGLIVITYPKPSTGHDSFTLSYLPPETVVDQF